MFPDEDRVEGWYETIVKLHLALCEQQKVSPLPVVASAFSGPNDLKKKMLYSFPVIKVNIAIDVYSITAFMTESQVLISAIFISADTKTVINFIK